MTGFTNDVEKRMRWQETIAWAGANGCSPLVEGIREEDFYQVHEPTAYDEIGPLGGPCYRPWDFEAKTRPSHEDIVKHLNYLKSYWPDIASPELAALTSPLRFTGRKKRLLVVSAQFRTEPPWGSWIDLSPVESKRRLFTRFRSAVNKAIAPHEVDHIDFVFLDGVKNEENVERTPKKSAQAWTGRTSDTEGAMANQSDDPIDDDGNDLLSLSSSDIAILERLALELRSQLAGAEVHFIRSAATAISAIERLPKPTPGVHVSFGYRTPNINGNHRWADILLTEEGTEAGVGEHFYDPQVGGDTESKTLFWAGVGKDNRTGSLEEWFETASGMAVDLFVSDESETDLIDWEAE